MYPLRARGKQPQQPHQQRQTLPPTPPLPPTSPPTTATDTSTRLNRVSLFPPHFSAPLCSTLRAPLVRFLPTYRTPPSCPRPGQTHLKRRVVQGLRLPLSVRDRARLFPSFLPSRTNLKNASTVGGATPPEGWRLLLLRLLSRRRPIQLGHEARQTLFQQARRESGAPFSANER